MSDLIKLEQVDQDGAIREAEEAVAGDSRADFFRKAAIGGGTAIGGGMMLSGFPSIALGQKPSKKNDVKILEFALTLEYLEAAFYKEALAKAGLTGDLLSTTKIVSAHETTHVKFLQKALGGARKAPKAPKFKFGNTTSNQVQYLKTAVLLEDTGVKAYSGQAGKIKQGAILKAAASILTVEARHASRFRTLNNQNFAPAAFDKAASKSAVLKGAKPFLA